MNERISLFPFRGKGGLIALVTAATALLAAATPGYLAYTDSTGDKAKALAKESGATATKAHEKTELAYELLRQRIEFQEKLIEMLYVRVDGIHLYGGTNPDMGMERPVMNRKGSPGRAPVNGVGVMPPGDIKAIAELEELDLDAMRDGDGDGDGDGDLSEMPVQNKLPIDLNEAMKKR